MIWTHVFHQSRLISSKHVKCRQTLRQLALKGAKRKVICQLQAKDGLQSASRLFSNLNPKTLKHEPGTVWGSALLVAGTTVGAGILALPAVTEAAGFVPSSVALVITCAYSVVTGLLLAEVNVNTMCELGAGGVSLVSMAERTLGRPGAVAASAAYVFLHYVLLVAYISKAGGIVADVLALPPLPCSCGFTLVFGLGCYLLSPRAVDQVNAVLVGLVVATFLALLGVAGQDVELTALSTEDWSAVPATLPVMALAFVYQNVVPVVVSSLEGDQAKVRSSILWGSLIPLLMFVSWDAAVLGSIGRLRGAAQQQQEETVQRAAESSALPTAAQALTAPPLVDSSVQGAAHEKFDPLAALQASSGVVGPLVLSFSFLAIATSFIGFVLSLTDFVEATVKLPTGQESAAAHLLVVVPPLVLSVSSPGLFFSALDAAGTYGVLTLFGLLPAAMVWSERYGGTTLRRDEVMPGGRPMLLLVGTTAAGIILNELSELVWKS